MKPLFYIPFFAVLMTVFLVLLTNLLGLDSVNGALVGLLSGFLAIVAWAVEFVILCMGGFVVGWGVCLLLKRGLRYLERTTNRTDLHFTKLQHYLTAVMLAGITGLLWIYLPPWIVSWSWGPMHEFFAEFGIDSFHGQQVWFGVAAFIEVLIAYAFTQAFAD